MKNPFRPLIPPGRKSALALALLALAAGASACGSSSGNSSSGGTSSPSAGLPSGADPALAKLVPSAIRAKGALTVAANATYPPDEYFASDNTTIIGFDPDLAAAVGKLIGIKFNFTNASFATIIPGLQANRFDIGWSSATATSERQQQVNFVTYFQSGIGFLVPAGSTEQIGGLTDLCGLKVAVEAGSLEDTTATAQSTACKGSGKPAIQLQTYQDMNQNLLALSSGRAQVALGGSQILPYLAQQAGNKFKVVGTAYDVGTVGVEIPKTTPIGLAEAIQGALNKMIADGSYDQIMSKWHEQAGEISHSDILPAPAAG